QEPQLVYFVVGETLFSTAMLGKVRGMMRPFFGILRLPLLLLLMAGLLGPASLPLGAQSGQNIPDAPSVGRTPQQLPNNGPAMPGPRDQAPPPPENAPPPGSSSPHAPGSDQSPPPPPGNSAAAPGYETSGGVATSRDGMFTLVVNTNFVTVPVTVKDPGGHLVEGLTMKDFGLYENGVEQRLKLFTSDPFPLSAAVIFDLTLPDSEVRKVNQTLPALTGAFSPYDEVSLYAFGNTVARVSDFTAIGEKLNETLRTYRESVRGRGETVPVVTGPLAGNGPYVNGHPMDPSVSQVPVIPRESHVLNDAVLAAARELSKRDRTRRKIIFIISDGRELGSNASYSQVLKVLLSQEITVYAVAVGSSAIPGYGQL